jgi:type I restriction enzyme, S subunit
MNAERLLQHFDRLSEAPDAIPRLRRFILDLAVRGKLVEQDPNDEPATELLKRIEIEKARLVKGGKINGQKPLDAVEPNQAPYELPANWKWVRFGETVNNHLGGGTPSKNDPTYWDGDIYWASVKDIGKGKYVDETIDRISEGGLADSSSNLIPPGNLIVVTRMGLGKVSINRVPIAINQDLRALFLSSLAAIDYYYIFFKTHGFEGTGLTVKGIKLEELLNIAFPLSPLAEQHRIVAKVDELMALCDQLEAAKIRREQSRDRLVAASLHHLNQPADVEEADTPETFRDHVRFIFNHLPRFTTHPEHIKQLRETILNLAVGGKLVSQDPNDEPASELLKRIREDKARLVKEGIIPQQKVLHSDQKRFAIQYPVKWEAVNFGNICNLVTSGSRGWAEFYSDAGPKFIRAQNIRFGRLQLDDLACVNPPKKTEGTRTRVSNGDLLIVITGAGVTNPALLDHELGEAYVSQHVALIKPTATSLSRWLLLCLMAPAGGRAELVERAYGAGRPGLNLDNIRSLNIPLPPLAEQHRIVVKVDELMALCDQLEAQLATTEADSRRLLEAVLHEALNPPLEAAKQ